MTGCKIVNGKCDGTNNRGNTCYRCVHNPRFRDVPVSLAFHEYQFLKDLCDADDEPMPVSVAMAELIRQGIRSLQRHV